jgi:tetratricopeptide (TPR) repeat protein
MRQLDSVFLFFNQSEENSVHLFDEYSKIIGSFSQSNLLLESIKQNVLLANKQSETFKFYDQNQKSTRDLSKESATFLWLKLFRDIFVELPLDKYAKTDMISKLKEYYHNNNKQLKLIDEFNRNYKSKDALRWYTGQPFIYKQLNRALRTENIEQLHTFRFFIADLCSSIIEEHQFIKEYFENITLYRGLTMSITEFEKLKDNVGKLISTNGFLSTSRSKDVAKIFVGGPIENKQNIFFEIECNIDKLQDAIVFADIARFSKYPEEKEVLFDLGATFEILSINKDESDCWLVHLKATDIGEKISQEYIQSNRREMKGESGAFAFAGLLAEMGDYTQALSFYERLLYNDSGEDKAWIFNGIGTIYSGRRDFDKAIENLSHAYELMIKAEPQRVEESTIVLNNLGNLFTSKGEYDKAIIHFLEALMNRRRLFGDQLFNLDADIMCNIGTVYFLEGKDYDISLDYYLKAFEIQETCYPSNHVIIANALHNIANCYLKKEDYDQSLKYFNDCLAIRKQILPPEHVDLASTLANMGTVYCKMGKMDESLGCFTKSLKIYETIFPNGHPNTSICLTNVGHFYHSQDNYDEALKYFEKAFEMNELFLSTIHSDIAGNLINIANVLIDQDKQEEALIYRLLSFVIEEKLYPNGSINMINNLDKIAEIYFQKGEYPRAIAYNLKTLVVIKCLPRNDQIDPVRTANILSNMGMAFMMKGEIDLSLAYHIRALHRRNKIFPDGHSSICSSLTHTATLYHLKGQHILALQYYEKALMMHQKLLPDTYPINYNVGEIFFNISNIHTITNNLNLAQQYAEKALDVFHNTTVPGNSSRKAAEDNIAKIIELMR